MAVQQSVLQIRDLVKETTTSTGTGTITLSGAPTGFQTFLSAFSSYGPAYYVIAGGAEWEVGWGRAIDSTFERNKVFASSNSGALVNFSVGEKIVRAVNPAQTIQDTNKQIHSASTTNATEVTLFVYGVTDFEHLIWPDSVLAVHFTVVARQTGGTAGTIGDSYTAKYSVLIKSLGSVVSIVSGPTEITGYSHKDAAFGGSVDVAIAGGLYTMQIRVTGEADKNIDWKAYVEFFEVK